MLFKLFCISSLVIASVLAEAPLERHRSAPYAAAGFRPDRPFNLPGEYLPPTVDDAAASEQQQYDPSSGFSYEISKQRVDFAGQEVQTFPVSQPHRLYGPPPTAQQPGFVNNQGLPNGNNGRPFFDQPTRRPNFGRPNFQGRPLPRPQPNNPQQPQGIFPPQRLPNPATDERFEPQQTFPDASHPAQPAAQYGAPVQVDPRHSGYDQQQQDNIDELQKQYALDALSAAVENYNRLQENQSDTITQGQYFVVNPDQTIQKVEFKTKQSLEEAKENDFTAELKYTKVGELKDPLYKYNAEGQLVRIVKK